MRIIFSILTLTFYSSILFSQTLAVPARNINAYNGSQFVSVITSLALTPREDSIYYQVINGNVPDFQRNLIPITITKTINSTNYTLTYYVLPDYLAIGCDTNYFLCPMTPVLAQKICNYINYTLPTRQMVNDIWTAATVKLAPSTIPPSGQMTTVPVFNQHNTTVWGQRSAVITAYPLGELVGGNKKDVVISNSIYSAPAPDRVVIYGWHQLNGSPIQPLYNGHESLYADYSHGIRLVQQSVTLNGSTTNVSAILQSSTLNSLLSDEGVISVPYYPIPGSVVSTPTSFAVVRESATSLRLKISYDSNVTNYKTLVSTDGISFATIVNLNPSNTVLTALTSNTIYYIKLIAQSSSASSDTTEVLVGVPSSVSHKVLIVNGFDRVSAGNTYDFVRQHGEAFFYNSYSFSSATNEAVINGLVNLTDFEITDYILGEESTVNETFSTSEQSIVKTYLENGGKLFVSGAEIAWDLDFKGTTTDKDFINNYLKAQYTYDAPNNQSATYYSASSNSDGIFAQLADFNFDNGTHGTYNVDYPDVITNINGSSPCLFFTGFASQYAGISYSGMFPSGTTSGKLVYFGFPFETIYPEQSRFDLMEKIIYFFENPNSDGLLSEAETTTIRIYPNPIIDNFNIEFKNLENETVHFSIISIDGKEVFNKIITPNNNQYTEKIGVNIPSGLYFLNFKYKDKLKAIKLLISQ
ncbi:MAG: hypothetical protein A2033_12320 [Bacteroidetes bacterium GWA2_31_9]|nr:MAG: hypothetical protein A2033_12320 [Bacteroidetes bacterium GWA2_31_9]